jgi:plasmid stability protein
MQRLIVRLQEAVMSTLTIRNVDAAMKERLRVRAAHNGRSMEAELRQILSDTLAPESGRELNLAEAIRWRFAPLGGVDLDPHPRVPVCEPPEFDR